MTPGEIAGTLEFLRRAEALKDTLRSGHTAGGRRESTAEHTWRLCLMGMLLGDAAGVDTARLIRILLVHDLAEAVTGDIPAPLQAPGGAKDAAERAALAGMAAPLPPGPRAEVLALFDDYAAAATPEAKLAKGLDKLETILQHLQGANPPGFDHAWNLGYGRAATDAHPLSAAIRAVLDAEIRARVGAAGDGA